MQHTLFFELLQVAVGRRAQLSKVPDEAEWAELFDMAKKQALVGVTASAIELLPVEQRPPKGLSRQWAMLTAQVEQQNQWLNAKCAEVTDFLQQEGFDTCILKGQGMAQLYPRPLRRQSGDIDVWVHRAGFRTKDYVDYGRQTEAGRVASNGAQSQSGKTVQPQSGKTVSPSSATSSQTSHPSTEATYHHIHIRLKLMREAGGRVVTTTAAQERPIDMEIHYRASWMFDPLHNYRLQRWFEQQQVWGKGATQALGAGVTQATSVGATQMHGKAATHEQGAGATKSQGFHAPSVYFNAVYQLVHIFRHLYDEGIGLRQLMDYYYVCQVFYRQEKERTEEWQRDLQRLGLLRLARAIMYVLHVVFGLPEDEMLLPMDEKEGAFLLEEIMLAGNFGRYDPRSTYQQGESKPRRFLRHSRRNLQFIKHYPRETIFYPIWTIGHRIWRWHKGYL